MAARSSSAPSGQTPPGVAAASQAQKVQLAYPEYPDVVIANIADVKSGEPIFFEYPQTGQKNMLVKIDRLAEEGVGPDTDIVAFSTACSHMGAPPRQRLQPRVRHARALPAALLDL